MLYRTLDEMIGNTPLLEISRFSARYGLRAHLYAKLEKCNPGGSAKDRVARQILDAGMADGTITKDTIVIEPTSGNTGIGLAAVAASRGMKVILTMPDTMSAERINILKALGAQIVLTPGSEGMSGAISKAQELKNEMSNSIIAGQFVNPDNPLAHYKTTGPEIWRDLDGRVDALVATAGTGGTITGTARFLKEQNNKLHVVAVEPAGSPVLSGGKPGSHKLQGIGAGFVPEVLDTGIYDEVITVEDEAAFETARTFGRTEGVLVGITSGAALNAAIRFAKNKDEEYNIVVILPDGGDRYYSTPLFVSE